MGMQYPWYKCYKGISHNLVLLCCHDNGKEQATARGNAFLQMLLKESDGLKVQMKANKNLIQLSKGYLSAHWLQSHLYFRTEKTLGKESTGKDTNLCSWK